MINDAVTPSNLFVFIFVPLTALSLLYSSLHMFYLSIDLPNCQAATYVCIPLCVVKPIELPGRSHVIKTPLIVDIIHIDDHSIDNHLLSLQNQSHGL
jgi:hypothetical protein